MDIQATSKRRSELTALSIVELDQTSLRASGSLKFALITVRAAIAAADRVDGRVAGEVASVDLWISCKKGTSFSCNIWEALLSCRILSLGWTGSLYFFMYWEKFFTEACTGQLRGNPKDSKFKPEYTEYHLTLHETKQIQLATWITTH